MNLNNIYDPKSIAIIGASAQKGSVGSALYLNASKSKLKRDVYPVNINGKKIAGRKVYVNVKDIKKEIDLAVIATPAFTVPGVIRDCIEAGVKGVVIISSGFSEIGEEGKKLVDDILRVSKKSGLRIMGPNCLGFLNPHADLNMSFAAKQALPGRTALISQSGALCTAILDWSIAHNIGFSKFISIGSMIDIGFADLVEYLSNDEDTDNIVLYMESLNESRRFIDACNRLSGKKKIFALKSGRSQAGANAAKSHTGSLAGSDQAFDALFRQAGITRLDTIQDLYDVSKICSFKKTEIGNRLAIITNAGGPGVLSTDALYRLGGSLVNLSEQSIKQLNEKMPASWSKSNPIDIIGDADPERYKNALSVCLNDVDIDSILVVLTPQAMTNSLAVAKEIVKLTASSGKFVFTSFMGADDVREARALLYKHKIPYFDTPERAIAAYVKITKKSSVFAGEVKSGVAIEENKKETVRKIFDKVKDEKRKQLTEAEAKSVVTAYAIPILPYAIANSRHEAEHECIDLNFPIAMKILSPDILHKIDCGGVELDIKNQDEVVDAFERILISAKSFYPKADLRGVYMESMIKSDLEIIIGMNYDPVLGPVIMFGRGGTEVELYKDVAFGVLPMNRSQIHEMLKETKVYSRLTGYRNTKGVEIEKMIDIIEAVLQLVLDFSEIKEIDINPLAVADGEMFVLDAKIVID